MGDEATGVMGVWLLRSAYIERVDTRERSLPFGDDPRGVLILHEGGRMAAILTPSHQPGDQPPPMRRLLAYSGRYRIEPPNRFVTDVDIAWIPSWVGTPRARTFTLRDGALDIVTDPAPVEYLDGAIVVSVLTWVREDGAATRDATASDLSPAAARAAPP
jgi:Lipocalin-like domain